MNAKQIVGRPSEIGRRDAPLIQEGVGIIHDVAPSLRTEAIRNIHRAETRDTIPEVLELIVGHPDVDAVVYLGLGIQSNTAALMRSGPCKRGPAAQAGPCGGPWAPAA